MSTPLPPRPTPLSLPRLDRPLPPRLARLPPPRPSLPPRPAHYASTRAGIINLWDYRDEEFSFAGGWLVLRGPNGSGKTKALEVLFPFVLDGRIDPKRLNPFAAEDRTMKSNLLLRGQDSALGYVWIEFTHRETGEAVTCGIGLHAQRPRDTPARWHFVAEGRVGEDFSLLTHDDRPMTKKQLAAELGRELIASTADYRAAVDRRLFGLGRERYEQLLTLILTLRRPQLAKNLDPAKLSDTLTAGLRPLDDDLIAEAARSFDDMESVQRTLEGLAAADDATRAFLASYSTCLRVHARSTADRLTARRTETAERAAALRTAVADLAAARERQAAAETRAESADASLAAQRARLDQLRSSAAYQAVEQLADLERLVRTCEQTARQATAERERRTAATGRARAEAEHTARLAAELDAAVSRDAATVADHAHTAGLPWTPTDAEPARFALDDLQAQLAAAGQDYRPEWDGSDGVIVVRVADEEGPLPVAAFAQKISSHRRDQAELLSESEQRILEDALLTRLAQQIHDRTVDARNLIRRMNTDMRKRKMSSGTTVGVSWLLADHLDDEQRAVCALLDADAARLGPDGLARVRVHFAAQIKTARARHRDLPYRELLAEVLDYRRWRQFAFQLVRPGESGKTEERLTRARHSRLSGGEQSVSLHLPLFAAAHAMLNSADPHAPRLLALDEAFAGVDDTGRGELMSLAAQFDLDLFMTGYDLWAAHASVSAAAQ
ncbi:SbcC/MukB-like Walker B domain-containing protein [Streptomyces sp. TRM68367]|uniref:SbcC/MukB-like Walker B domain-containing protein n=1 Tax=Streptomyces sp. TRM68367 TaxID=2758415 RepID=UPI0029342DDC|nr:SbcC/MukB-like Walker B domain-containing protein [Streptomyces sp. TRM68367]